MAQFILSEASFAGSACEHLGKHLRLSEGKLRSQNKNGQNRKGKSISRNTVLENVPGGRDGYVGNREAERAPCPHKVLHACCGREFHPQRTGTLAERKCDRCFCVGFNG